RCCRRGKSIGWNPEGQPRVVRGGLGLLSLRCPRVLGQWGDLSIAFSAEWCHIQFWFLHKEDEASWEKQTHSRSHHRRNTPLVPRSSRADPAERWKQWLLLRSYLLQHHTVPVGHRILLVHGCSVSVFAASICRVLLHARVPCHSDLLRVVWNIQLD